MIYSQPVMLALVDAGMDRHEAYAIVQEHAHRALRGGAALLDGLKEDTRLLSRVSEEDLASLFDPRRQLHNVADIFERLDLTTSEEHGIAAGGDA